MALSALFKKQGGANWETMKDDPYKVTQKLASVVATPPTSGTIIPKGDSSPTPITNKLASIVANPVKSGTIQSANIVGSPNKVEDVNPTPEVTPQTTNTMSQPTPQATPTEKITGNEGLINSNSDALISAIKAQIQQNINNKNMAVNALPEKYQPLKNEASARASQNVISLQEMLANRGDRGGIANSTLTDARMGGDRNVANIGMQQGQEEASLKNDIANLMLEGNIQEATVQGDRLRSLIAEKNRVEDVNYGRGQDTLAQQNFLTTNAQTQSNADRSFGLQQRQITNQESNDAFSRDIENKKMNLTTRQFDNAEAQQLMDNQYRNKVFDYQKERDNVADTMNGKQYQMELDKFQWQKSVDNPAQKAQIIENNIKDLQLGYMQDPNSPENQTRLNQAMMFKTQLDNLKAISPEMLVKEFNAGLDQIYQNISASKANTSINQQNANTSSGNLSLNRDEFDAKKLAGAYDTKSYKLDNEIKQDTLASKKLNDITNRLDSMFVAKVFDKNTLSEVPKVVGNKDDLARAILNYGLSESDTKALYARYGLPSN